MSVALNILKYIISKFFDFMFNAYIFVGVSLGMICIVVFIFSLLISALLNTVSVNAKDRTAISSRFKGKGDSNG